RGVWFASASLVLIALAGCDSNGNGAMTEQSSAENIAVALDACANNGDALCRNEAIAQLDSAARETLVAESASISDAGAALLVQNQNRWRDATRIACGLADPDAAPTPEQLSCLEARFRARAQEVREAVQEAGGYTFQRMELIDAAPVSQAMAASSGLGD